MRYLLVAPGGGCRFLDVAVAVTSLYLTPGDC
jgi:hypothetical protein